MTHLRLSTAVRGIDAQKVLDAMLEHLREHDLAAVPGEDAWDIDYSGARISLSAKPDSLHAHVAAPTQEALYDAKMLVFYHIVEFSSCDPEAIQWQGDSIQLARPPAFRLLTVEAVSDVGPHMRRVRFRTEELARYHQDEDIHCKLIFPQPGVRDPEWPTLASNGTPQFPSGEKRLDIRTYTIRRIDAVQGWMDVDFVLHDDAGPGAAWAAQAASGQQIGLSGPGGRTAQPADWMLLAGDETALPAIARIGESLPSETQGIVLIEVQTPADQVELRLPPGMRLRWLHRGTAAAGTVSLLKDAIQACAIPDGPDRYVWVGAEFATAQSVRAWLRDTVGLSGKEQLVVAYWRYGMDETQMKSGATRRAAGDAAEKASS